MMGTYRVQYFYLATGMEGQADEKDYGLREAETPAEAVESVVMEVYPVDKMYGPNNAGSSRRFLRGCLTAEEVPNVELTGGALAPSSDRRERG